MGRRRRLLQGASHRDVRRRPRRDVQRRDARDTRQDRAAERLGDAGLVLPEARRPHRVALPVRHQQALRHGVPACRRRGLCPRRQRDGRHRGRKAARRGRGGVRRAAGGRGLHRSRDEAEVLGVRSWLARVSCDRDRRTLWRDRVSGLFGAEPAYSLPSRSRRSACAARKVHEDGARGGEDRREVGLLPWVQRRRLAALHHRPAEGTQLPWRGASRSQAQGLAHRSRRQTDGAYGRDAVRRACRHRARRTERRVRRLVYF